MIEPHAAALAYVRFVLDQCDLTPSALAKWVGVSTTTLTRPLNNPEHKFSISTSTIAKIANKTGINPGPFFEAEDIVARHAGVLKDIQEGMERAVGYSIFDHRPKILPIVGEISRGEWDENDVLSPSYYGPKAITATTEDHDNVFGVGVVGEGANLIARHGEILLCARYSSVPQPHDPAVYILQRLKDGGRLIDLQACYLQMIDGVWMLCTASNDPRYQSRFPIAELEAELEGAEPGTRVIGFVLFVFREPWVRV